MSQKIQFIQTTPELVQNAIIESVKKELQAFKKELNLQTAKDDLMTREQVLDLLQINPSTLWHWQNKGKITVYKFANKCYYKRAEILASITPVKK